MGLRRRGGEGEDGGGRAREDGSVDGFEFWIILQAFVFCDFSNLTCYLNLLIGLVYGSLSMCSIFFMAFFNIVFYFVVLFFVTFYVYLMCVDFYVVCDFCIPFCLYLISFDQSFCSFLSYILTSFIIVVDSLSLLYVLFGFVSSYIIYLISDFVLVYIIVCNRFVYTLLCCCLSFYRFVYFDLYFLFLFYFLFVYINLFSFFVTDIFLFFIFLDFFGLFVDIILYDAVYYNTFTYLSTFISY